jgi:tetratricopeptide (TPR) repeat protein
MYLISDSHSISALRNFAILPTHPTDMFCFRFSLSLFSVNKDWPLRIREWRSWKRASIWPTHTQQYLLLTHLSVNTLASTRCGGKLCDRFSSTTRLILADVGTAENQEKALGSEHPDTAQSLNNLASLYDDQGKYDEAEPLYKQALAIREKALSSEHPDTASSMNNLAWLYDDQGKYDEAEPLYK